MESKINPIGMLGTSDAPALGIRNAAKTEMQTQPAESPRLKAFKDGSIQFQTSARLGSETTTKQQTSEPTTPLKQSGDEMKGKHIDVSV